MWSGLYGLNVKGESAADRRGSEEEVVSLLPDI